MDLSNLKPAKGSVKKEKRIGRGQGSGKGGTSTRGNKGAKSRSGYTKKIGFEGGQMPLARRVPKFGFKNINQKKYNAVNLDTLQNLIDKYNLEVIDMDILCKYGIVSKNDLVKILGRGEIKSPVEVKVHAFSNTAKIAIETAGGKVIKI
jgi:large subunit ribosomal protein L15